MDDENWAGGGEGKDDDEQTNGRGRKWTEKEGAKKKSDQTDRSAAAGGEDQSADGSRGNETREGVK